MKEFPRFVHNNKEYDLCFYDESINLYAVINMLSGIMVSNLIPAANDYVAINGFKNFVDKQNDAEVYELLRLGILNIQKPMIEDIEKVHLIDSREDIGKWLEDAKSFMISFNEEE